MEFMILAAAHFLALLSPGPDFFLILRGGLKLKLKYALAICLGIAVANAIYILLAILGLESLKGFSWLTEGLTYFGAAYLIYIGYMLLQAKQMDISSQAEHKDFLSVESFKKQFMMGFLSGSLNPKNIVFYLSLFTVLVSNETSVEVKLLYGIWMASIVFIWDGLIVLLISRPRVIGLLQNYLWKIEKMTGVILLGFGLSFPFF